MKNFKQYISEDYEQADNILDRISYLTSFEEAERLVKSYNAQVIGSGVFSRVYDNKIGELIIKIHSKSGTQQRGIKKDGWPIYINEIYKEGSLTSNPKSYYPSNPFYPKIYRMKTFSDGYIAAIERLNFGKSYQDEEEQFGKLLHFDKLISEFSTLSLPQYNEGYTGKHYFRDTYRNSYELLFHDLVKRGPYVSLPNHPLGWLYNKFIEYNGKYLEDAIHLIHDCSKNMGAGIDVHFGNIGWRDNGQVVIADPLS